jgi:hypothetical protein
VNGFLFRGINIVTHKNPYVSQIPMSHSSKWSKKITAEPDVRKGWIASKTDHAACVGIESKFFIRTNKAFRLRAT